MTLDRRRFLQLSALGVIATVADSACTASGDRDDGTVDHPQLLGILGPERVRQLGARYRADTPGENTAPALRAAISNGRGPRIPFTRNASIHDQIRDDFESGRIAVVDGWLLSVTEARQAALFSLTPA
jgi:hypothetical protein